MLSILSCLSDWRRSLLRFVYSFGDLPPLLTAGKNAEGYREIFQTWNLVTLNAFLELLSLR